MNRNTDEDAADEIFNHHLHRHRSHSSATVDICISDYAQNKRWKIDKHHSSPSPPQREPYRVQPVQCKAMYVYRRMLVHPQAYRIPRNIPSSPTRRAPSILHRAAFRLRLHQIDMVRSAETGKADEVLTEAGIGVFSLDALAPVLTEEHVCREGTLGGIRIFLGLARGTLLSRSFAGRLQ